MTKQQYNEIVSYMEVCMSDAAHDKEHIWRVLGYALHIAAKEKARRQQIDYDVLIAACLFHDIGRPAQFQDSSLDHAAVGADMAEEWLLSHGWENGFAQAVKKAIRSHRYRTGGRAETIEAQILFDADKLDVSGIMGLFRTVSYCDHVGETYYTVDANGEVEFTADAEPSVFQEYCYKLSKIKEKFYTQGAKEIAEEYSKGLDEAALAALREVRFARSGLALLKEPDILT